MGFVSKRRDDRVNDGRDDSMETGVRGREGNNSYKVEC